jgi:hypothetical protein
MTGGQIGISYVPDCCDRRCGLCWAGVSVRSHAVCRTEAAMTIGSLLASLTAGTLGLAALSPDAAEAGDFPSLNFIKFCLGPIRPKLESYVGRSLPQSGKTRPSSARRAGRLRRKNPEITATGAMFRDTCTKEWAMNAPATRTKTQGRCAVAPGQTTTIHPRTKLRNDVSQSVVEDLYSPPKPHRSVHSPHATADGRRIGRSATAANASVTRVDA